MRNFNRLVRYLPALFVITIITSGCKTLETKAEESYEYWRIRTGGTSVAAFYTENGLQETCHGFWARDYRETDPDSPCFAGTTRSGVEKTEEDGSVVEVEPEPVVEVTPEPSPIVEVEPEPVVEVTPEPSPVVKVEPAVVVPEKPWTPSPLTLWVVHKGEHLWGISAHRLVYGDPHQWPLLFKRNRHQIADADLIYPGQVLHIERNLSTAEIDRAIEHAKTRGAWILGITELSDLEYLSRERSYQ